MKQATEPELLVHITRSFSYKMNAGNYESRDFFCSQTVECKATQMNEASELVYKFCKQQVLNSVAEFKNSIQKPEAPVSQKKEIAERQERDRAAVLARELVNKVVMLELPDGPSKLRSVVEDVREALMKATGSERVVEIDKAG